MGDTPGSPAGVTQSNSNPQLPHDASGGLSPLTADGRTASSVGGKHASHQESRLAFSDQLDMNHAQANSRSNAYNMASLGNALPSGQHRVGQHSHVARGRYQHQNNSPTTLQQQVSQMGQYGHHHHQQPMGMSDQAFYGQQHMQYYAHGQMHSPHGGGQMPARQALHYYQPHMAMNPASTGFYYSQAGQYPGHGNNLMGQMGGHYGPRGSQAPTGVDPRYNNATVENQGQVPGGQPQVPGNQSLDGHQNTVRGPPRKPRQSGHAIWIGNLPPQTDLMSLVQHVCKEAPGLQSLFLISKSNCAFANYKDEAACASAQQKIHDSKFHSVRLVSRLRKSTVEGASGTTAPTGPASTTQTSLSPSSDTAENPSPDTSTELTNSGSKNSSAGTGTPQQDKFFILKSLTVEDLELSVKTGIWATQAHNEESLNGAFKAVENVYLVFSANKSGEYFGYARMLSEINKDPAAAIEFAPTVHTVSDLDLPKAIPTEDSEFAPRGKIIDDSARGTIFWEIDRDSSDTDSDVGSEVLSEPSYPTDQDGKTWGKPFKLEWLSTHRLPFYRTRGLRNPWNSNREVKIARDGTELEPSVGRRLIGLFNRIQNPGPMGSMLRAPMGPIPPGYPQMRPYGQ